MTRSRLLFWAWTALILLVVLPWVGVQDHAHWERVAWVPFISPPVKVRDVLANIVLYVPWGYFYLRHVPGRWRQLWLVMVFAAMVSLASETAQLYSHGRFPSATDATCNVFGAFIGAWYARRHAC